ncbi:MAG: hypothetical protein P8L74_00175 [Gammaproteobacteria bacterium]|nr:hypothetical protein [Gammaproteobacteria bacterium]
MTKTVSLLTCLKGREDYITRYLYLSSVFDYKHKILILKEQGSTHFKIPEDLDVSVIETDTQIYGMSDIFKVLNRHESTILKFKYCHYVEDDNFIFTESLDRLVDFLESSCEFSAAVGNAFLHDNKTFSFLNSYRLPSIKAQTSEERLLEFNGGLTYYSLFKTEEFTKICNIVSHISDNNMSEISFNISAVVKIRVKYLNVLFLAREYPRPRIYNIPSSLAWITDQKFSYELRNLVEILVKELKLDMSYQDFFNIALADYFSSRFSPKEKLLREIISNFYNKTILKNSKEVKEYLELLKSFNK